MLCIGRSRTDLHAIERTIRRDHAVSTKTSKALQELVEEVQQGLDQLREEALRQINSDAPVLPQDSLQRVRESLQKSSASLQEASELGDPNQQLPLLRSELETQEAILEAAREKGERGLAQEMKDLQRKLLDHSEDERRVSLVETLEELAQEAANLVSQIGSARDRLSTIEEQYAHLLERKKQLEEEIGTLRGELAKLPDLEEIKSTREGCVDLAKEKHDLQIHLSSRIGASS
jgi:chromosome segregation ATPase